MKKLVTVFVVLCFAVCTAFADTGKVEKLQSEIQQLNKQISELRKTVELQRAEIERLKTLCQRNGVDLSPTQQTSVSQLKYNVVESKMLNDARIISITTMQFDRAKDIAMELVSQNKSYYMVRVFLYKPEQIPGRDLATIRYEWTESQGLVKSFDTRIPAPRKDTDPTLPKYEVLFRVKQSMGNGRIYGDVLIVSFSRATTAKNREQVARAICKQERLDDICLYSTRDAYEANMSASYSKSHPDALKKGFLGSLTDGKFVAGEVLFP